MDFLRFINLSNDDTLDVSEGGEIALIIAIALILITCIMCMTCVFISMICCPNSGHICRIKCDDV